MRGSYSLDRGPHLSRELQLSQCGENLRSRYFTVARRTLTGAARNEVYFSASYLWSKKLRTTVEANFVNAREELNFGGPNFDIEDYTFVNLAAEYEINSCCSVFARITNLTDEQYSEVFGFPALGRTALAGFKVRF